jgi:DNA-binding transcriptional MocR family regulator
LPDATADCTILTTGGQHGISLLLSALARPGDLVAVEQLTYPVFKAAALQLGVPLIGVESDAAGLLPEALDAACRARTVRVLYTMPTLHNPTTVTMPPERRRDIAEICRRHDLAVIEDDVYGFLCNPPNLALTSLMPERGFYLSSTSKCFAPGLRLGYVHVPPRDRDRVIAALRTSTFMAAPLMAAIGSRWITNGVGDRLAEEKRRLSAARYAVARDILAAPDLGTTLHGTPQSMHCWLTLPAGWRADEFAAAAHRAGIGVTPTAAFAAVSGTPPAIRICLGIASTMGVLQHALRTLAGLLSAMPGAYLSVV